MRASEALLLNSHMFPQVRCVFVTQLPTKEGEHVVCNDHVTVDSERL